MSATRAARTAAQQHAPRVPFTVLVVGLIAGGLALLLLLNTASAANELRRHDLADADAGTAAAVQQLQVEVAAQSAPDALAEAATAMGMVPVTHPAFLLFGAHGSVRVLGHAGAATGQPFVPVLPKAAPRRPAEKPAAKKPAAKKPAGKTTTAKKPTAKTAAAKKTAGKNTAAKKTAAKKTAAPNSTVTLPGGTR